MAKKTKGKVVQMLSPENYIRQKARTLPIYECIINDDWEESGIANLVVSRKHTNGNLTIGMFLVDLKCLGIKDAIYWHNIYEHDYRNIIDEAGQQLKMINISYPLAHNIVYAGIEYAEEFGFQPHKNFKVAQYILEEDSDEIEIMEIECGIDGKPAYVRGPLDTDTKQARVIAKLEETAGAGNYIFIGDDDELENVDENLNDFNLATYQLKIQLNNIKNPPVWRRVKVPSEFTFYELHEIIQLVFGWTNSHLFMFSPGSFGTTPVITDTDYPEDYDENSHRHDAYLVVLSDIFKKEKQHFTYTYDFGDSWEHKITLEKIIRKASFYPECIDGKGKCPPEDCGGIWGFEQLKEIMADKNHPEYREMARWLRLRKNETWNSAEFDLDETQQILEEAFNDDEQ